VGIKNSERFEGFNEFHRQHNKKYFICKRCNQIIDEKNPGFFLKGVGFVHKVCPKFKGVV